MKGIIHFSILLIVILLSACGNKPIYTSKWNSDQIVIDGTFLDWKSEIEYDSKSKFLYNVSNDRSNLYICLKVTEPNVKNKIMMRGFTVWIDTTGKQKTVLGIKYPMGRNRNMAQQNQNTQRQPVTERQGERPPGSQFRNQLELIGYNEKGKSEVVNFENAGGVEIAVNEDPYGGMQYEAKIPLTFIFNNPEAFLSGSENSVSLGFETGYVRMESGTSSGRPGGGMGGGGGGRSGGGGRPPGGGRPGGMAPSGNMAGMTQPTKLWLKQIKLTILE